MEVVKPKDNLSFQIDDVTFSIRSTVAAGDKFELDVLGDFKNGVFVVDRGAIFKKVVELFVEDWTGVTEDGKPVPYRFVTLMTKIPGDMSKDWILKLGVFIIDALQLFGKPDDSKKNGSPGPSTSS